MFITFYGTGTHRLIYEATGFGIGLTVTAYIWNPSLTKSALQTLTEVSDGLYYLDYDFTVLGNHFGKFYEGGSGKVSGVFEVIAAVDTIVDRILAATEVRQASVTDVGATTTKFDTTLTETSDNFWDRMALLFTSGNNKGQMRRIKNYDGTSKEVTLQTPLDVAPTDGDDFIIVTVRAFLTPDIEDLADAVWDEVLTGATHNISTSAGRRLRQIGAYNITDGTAQDGNSYSITLAAGESAVDHIFNRNLITILVGTGAGQTRTIVDYDATTKIAVVDRDWWVIPDGTSEYFILADDTPLVVDHGVAQAGENTTITLRSSASSVDDTYVGGILTILAGLGKGQIRLIHTYNGTSKIAAMCAAWKTNPDGTSVYVIMPYGRSKTICFGDTARAQINTECDSALVDYDPPTRTEATADKDEIIAEVDANETKIDGLQVGLTAVKTKTDNLPSGIAKNVALNTFTFYMVLTSDHVTAAVSKTLIGQISKDGGAFVGLTNNITEIGNGLYKVDITQAEMNADIIALKFTETDCDQRIVVIYPT